jgi:hypothetical protein
MIQFSPIWGIIRYSYLSEFDPSRKKEAMIKENGIWKCECGEVAIHNFHIGYMCNEHGTVGLKGIK